MGQVLTADELEKTLAPLKREGQTIVSTNGCFDILHVGHLRYLQEAKKMGDVLVVCINSDASVKGLKGPERPLVCEDDRAELLAGLECVDYVVIFDAPTPEDVLKQIKPDIHVKGGDYNPESLPEAATLKAMNTELRFVNLVANRSTTNLVDKIKAAQ